METRWKRSKNQAPERNWLGLVLPASLSLLMLAALALQKDPASPEQPEGFANPILLIITKSMEAVMEDRGIRILDARETHHFKEGHIPGALNVTPDSLVDFDSRIKGARLPDNRLALKFGVLGIDADTHVIVYDGEGGRQSARLVWALHYLGHPLVSVLHGGFQKWQEEGRPTTQEVVRVPRKTFAVDRVSRRLATADWILENLDNPDVVVVDVRDQKSYAENHIPGAVSLPWQNFLHQSATRWKPPAELKVMLESAAVTPDKEVAVYSDVGQMSALPYLILRALGYARVRSYDRGWAEWVNDFSLPKSGRTSLDLPLLKAVFRANGCANCHGVSSQPRVKGVTFTDGGKTAAELGLGCINLLKQITNLAELKAEMAAKALQNFRDHGCVKCHDQEGKGATRSNLNAVGQQFQDLNLGCVDMMFTLR